MVNLYHKCLENLEYEKFSNKFRAKEVLRKLVRSVIPSLINKIGPKLLAEKLGESTKLFFRALQKGACSPVGYASDAVQFGLELLGYESAGSWVGFTGNIAGGAISGFFVGGPFGAVAGGAAGYGV